MNYTTNEGLTMYYELHGNMKANKTIIFLNGLSQSTLSWGLVIPYFKDNYRVLLLDQILQGQSDKNSDWRNFDQHAKDVLELLIALQIKQPIIAGLSYGSMVAQHFAVRYPNELSKLILMATLAHKTPYFDAIGHAWWRALEAGGYPLMFDVMLPNVLSENYFKNPLIPIKVMKDARLQSGMDSTSLIKLMKATQEREDYRPMLKNIKVPTLVMQGEKDSLLPPLFAEEVHKNIFDSTLLIIKDAGHTLNLEAVPEISKQILQFVA
jgi:pimeloyl-ACP methyl ester carboxylesterase